MDKITPEIRSRNMSRIRSKNTKPELALRRMLFSKGYRYRIHYPLPGKPDIVFPSKKIAIFVNGCFWHGHGCKLDHISKTNSKFWNEKIKSNKKRDQINQDLIKNKRWKVIVIWECSVLNEFEEIFSTIKITF